MFFDFKITTWERITVPEEHEQTILAKIQSGDIKTGNDLFVIIEEITGMDVADRIVMTDTEYSMTPEENGGQATIEVRDSNRTMVIWNNSKPEANPFPNGFDNWQETHFEIVKAIFQNEETSFVIQDAIEKLGTGGLYELAKDMTTEFEREYESRDWDDGDYFDTVEEFINEKLYPQS